ncbi:hypothetical protein [Blastococcus sp. TF02A-30]|uniref:hypothetical protein n=1 Tax=Blastococcus sp. TF02A-30 TaxID=2250580 RepID=UPI001314DFDF|nr:hypothetical protein [Blastococcus sp. TF02A-30]
MSAPSPVPPFRYPLPPDVAERIRATAPPARPSRLRRLQRHRGSAYRALVLPG